MEQCNLLAVEIPPGSTPEAALRIKLKKARALAELSQAELGRLMGRHHNYPSVSGDTIYYWEKTGNIPGTALGAIAAATGTPWEYWRI
jgi:transcriptional regulator with XRE-family HTH domain